MASAPAAAVGRGALLPSGWPLQLALVGFPLLWVLGTGPVAWVLVAVPMLAHLAVRERVEVPPGFLLLLGFLAWVLITGTQVDTSGRLIAFAYRWVQYAAGAVALLYAFNLDPRISNGRVLAWMSTFWLVVVAGGYLGLVAGEASLPNPLLPALPGAIAGDDFVRTLFQPPFAQVHTFLGYPLPRPAAPFPYTNTWGATFALLLPAVAATLADETSRRRRRWLRAGLVAATIPAIVSVNRGMWLSIVAWLAFTATQRTPQRIRRAVGVASTVLVIGLVAGSLSPLGALVRDRLETPHSNNARRDVAEATIDGILASPLLGHGAPRPFEGPGVRPPLGTQGQLWYVAFSHGLPALLLLAAFFLLAYRNVAPDRCPRLGLWTRSTLVMLLLLVPFYDIEGVPLVVVFVLIGLALRESTGRAPADVPAEGTPAVALR